MRKAAGVPSSVLWCTGIMWVQEACGSGTVAILHPSPVRAGVDLRGGNPNTLSANDLKFLQLDQPAQHLSPQTQFPHLRQDPGSGDKERLCGGSATRPARPH